MPRLLPDRLFLSSAVSCGLLIASGNVRGQAAAAGEAVAAGSSTASATTNDAGPAGIVPATKGFNVSLGSSTQHDSSNGWSTVLTPDLAYRFNRYFSMDAAVPVYGYINVEQNVGTKAAPVYKLATKHGALGDTPVAGHVDLSSGLFDYNGTAVIAFPTGKTAYGLGAGKVTYDVNNHFESDFGPFTPDVELGIADSNSLINARVRRDFTTVGTVAHFQAGGSVSLPWNASFEADAYELLPLTSSTTYSTTGRGKKKVTTVVGGGSAEDNGVLTSLDVPVSGHVTVSGFYNRSVRDHDDTAGLSLTFLLKAPPRESGR